MSFRHLALLYGLLIQRASQTGKIGLFTLFHKHHPDLHRCIVQRLYSSGTGTFYDKEHIYLSIFRKREKMVGRIIAVGVQR